MIHTIGDSHAIAPYDRLGPSISIHYYIGITMKRLGNPEERALHQWVSAANPQPGDALIFVCGEIDVRAWANVHATQRGKRPDAFLSDWACDYLDKIKTAPNNDARRFVQSVSPPGREELIRPRGPEWPVSGSDAERAGYTSIMNAALRSGCRCMGLNYLDVHSLYVDESGMLDPSRSDDGVHITEPTAFRALLVEHGLLAT